MNSSFKLIFALFLLVVTMTYCRTTNENRSEKTRPLKDTVGFAQYAWQMDSLMARISRAGWKSNNNQSLKFAVCPHDDYTYTGALYPELLQNIRAKNLILIGVAHGAAKLRIEDSLVFDSFTYWKGPWKDVPVSPVREELFGQLKGEYAIISDTLHKTEHSLESMIPFLQYFNRDISIIPVLVPAMDPQRMEDCGKALAKAISIVAEKHDWEWGSDYAIIVTTDAVHYGNEDWGGSDYAFFGCDEAGNERAMKHENEILQNCFTGRITADKIRMFTSYTLDDENFRKYKWTWCGRYSVPVAMYCSLYLDDKLEGVIKGYSTSITASHIPVDDLRMGRTAIATTCHWVGYAAIGYK